MDSACPYTFNYEIVPIFYRTHAHLIIPVISGYLIRDEEWIELGRMSPFQPEVCFLNLILNILFALNYL